MASPRIDIPSNGTWTQIMPATATGYCVVESGPIVFMNNATQPAFGVTDGSTASAGDVISGFSGEAVWARPVSQNTIGRVKQHNV